ncbi:MAG: FeoA family protein [Candidatus Acidiferrales bacterium]
MTTGGADASPSPPPAGSNHIPLDSLPTATRAEVVHLSCAHQSVRKLAQLGIVAGAILQVQRSAPLGGPILVEIQGSMVALGRRLAHRVLVRILP